MNRENRPIIIVKRKKKVAGGHHGGSWKVAYADFVTAMMAFFLVMWIMGMEEGVRDLVQGYFLNPVGFKKSFSGGKNLLSSGNTPAQIDIRTRISFRREQEREALEAAAEEMEAAIQGLGLDGADVETIVTDEGLRIEMMETGNEEIFFDRSSADLKPGFQRVLAIIGPELMKLPNPVVLEGHTDGAPFPSERYTNWELSFDRVSAARRALVREGLEMRRLVGMRGLADRELKVPDEPYAPRNRRVTILLPFVSPDPNDPETLRKLGFDLTVTSSEEMP